MPMKLSAGSRNLAVVVGLIVFLGVPLAGVAWMRAINCFIWICLVIGAGALSLILSGFRREGAMLVPLMMMAPAAPIGIWLAVEPGLSAATNWRTLALTGGCGFAGWLFAHLSPAIAGWRADRLTSNAIRHAHANIEKHIAEWGDDIARPYAQRPALPARVKNLR